MKIKSNLSLMIAILTVLALFAGWPTGRLAVFGSGCPGPADRSGYDRRLVVGRDGSARV